MQFIFKFSILGQVSLNTGFYNLQEEALLKTLKEIWNREMVEEVTPCDSKNTYFLVLSF